MYLYDFSAVISVDFLSIVVAPVKHFKITPVLIDCLLLGSLTARAQVSLTDPK